MNSLLGITRGLQEVKIGVIDGPVESSHPDFEGANLKVMSSESRLICLTKESPACLHGTFIAGILSAKRESVAPAISPGCSIILKPIFCEAANLNQCPEVTPANLASAVKEMVGAGARVINLSLGMTSTALQDHPELRESFDYAFQKGVLVIAAAGNQGRIGHIPLFTHPWIIPVGACDEQGRVQAGSNIGSALGKRGLLAPGVGITSTCSTGGHIKMSGTSVATPFVTGAIAILWSLFPKASAERVRTAILLPGVPRKSIVPPLMNGEASWAALKAIH